MAIFGGFFTFALWRGSIVTMTVFGFLVCFAAAFAIAPLQMRPVYLLWMKIAHIMGVIMTGVILTVFYFLVITPVGICYRLVKGAAFPLKPDPNVETYWVSRDEPVQPIERYIKRY